MDWHKTLDAFFAWLFSIIRGWFSRSTIKSTDKGLFDPFIPVGPLKRVDWEYQAGYELTGQPGFFAETDSPTRSFLPLRLLMIIGVAVIGIRLIGLQITQGAENFSLAEGNRLKTQLVPAPRGLMYDRNGIALVHNSPNFSVVLNLNDYPTDKSRQQDFVQTLAVALGQNPQTLSALIDANKSKESVAIEEGIDRDKSLSLELRLNGINGVVLVKSPSRDYIGLPSSGHVLGYTGKVTEQDLKDRPDLLPTSTIGKSGLESTYDQDLQGINGTETLEVDSLGRAIRSVGTIPPQSGKSILLSLDSSLQQISAQALKDSISKNKATSGVAVAMDVTNGEILSMVSVPDFDSNVFSNINPTHDPDRQAVLNNPQSPLINRAIAGQYPSGSTIKPVFAAAALQEKTITPTTKLDTSAGKITVGQSIFSDWKIHGITDVRQALAESNNIFFYSLGGGYGSITGLGVKRQDAYLEKFGMGKPTGIDLPGEASGLVPSPDWKQKVKNEQWYLGDSYNLAIGQGDLLITPLQLTRAVAAVANGGKLLAPHLAKSILGPIGEDIRDIPTVVQRDQLVDSNVLQVVREGMRQAVTSGSARSFSGLAVQVAAKTGTAQFNITDLNKSHSWFTCFAPYDNPKIAISVIVEGGGEGFSVAAPVAKNIVESYFHLPLTPIIAAPPEVPLPTH